MVSGISNQLSCHYSCNHDFHELHQRRAAHGRERIRKIALDRSPLIRLDKPTTPTLILHGAEDRCTPLGQAQEFYAALARARRARPSWSSIRARATASRSASTGWTRARRAVAWFDRYLGGGAVSGSERRPLHPAGGSPSPCRFSSSSPSASSRWCISRPATRCARCSARGRPTRRRSPTLRERYHLNDPFIVQYGKWLWQVLQGDLGRSINGNRRVLSAIKERASVTIYPEPDQHGDRARRRHPARRASRPSGAARGSTGAIVMFGVFGISSPAFVTGIFLLYVFGVVLGWFPTFGAGPRLPRPLLASDAAGGRARALGHGDRRQDHARRHDRGAGQGLCRLRPRARHERDAHHLRLRAAQRADPGGDRGRASSSSGSSPARSMSR